MPSTSIDPNSRELDLLNICPQTSAAALQRAVTLAPDIEAIVAADGRLTFAQLDAEVTRVRAALVGCGIKAGDHVGICLGNRAAWVTLFLALGSIGAVTVPVNTRFRAEEIAYALGQSKVSALFVADRFLSVDFIAMLREICPALDRKLPDAGLPALRQVIVLGDEVPSAAMSWHDFLRRGEGVSAATTCTPDDVLLIQYTSGTTSFPKGVMLTHRNMVVNGFAAGFRIGLRPADRFHSARPFFHVAGSSQSILSCLQHAATLVTMDRFEATEALQLMQEERCTHFSGNDTMALMLLNHPQLADYRLALRGAWCAASPVVVRRVIDELGAREVVVPYGLSECSPNVSLSCWWEPEEIRVASRMRLQPGIEVRIRDTETGELRPAGEVGEIVVHGWCVMRGYFDKPVETAAVLSEDGWLSTGDLGRLGSDGRLEFVGRAKDIIRVGGENVAPSEVEGVLLRHPDVRLAQVVGVPDPRLIEVVAAFVVLNDNAAGTEEDLIAWCRERLAGFKVPRHLGIVEGFESIGMTASSKVQKKMLAAHAVKLFGLE